MVEKWLNFSHHLLHIRIVQPILPWEIAEGEELSVEDCLKVLASNDLNAENTDLMADGTAAGGDAYITLGTITDDQF